MGTSSPPATPQAKRTYAPGPCTSESVDQIRDVELEKDEAWRWVVTERQAALRAACVQHRVRDAKVWRWGLEPDTPAERVTVEKIALVAVDRVVRRTERPADHVRVDLPIGAILKARVLGRRPVVV